jgi:integrase/recombinase XerD
MGSVTVEDALASFVVAGRADGLSERTLSWYEMVVRAAFADGLTGEVGVVVTLQKLRTFLAELRARHSEKRPDRLISPATVRGYTRGLKRFCHWLHEEGYLAENPASRLRLPKAPKRTPKGIVLDDLRRMVAVADVRERALMYFLIDTGCRAGEVCGLTMNGLDITNGTATVIGKGNKERVVYLVESTRAALRAWFIARSEEKARSHVFCGIRGPLTPVGLYQVLKRVAARAGVSERWNPHAFRHAYAREHLLNGGDLASLADLLGHEDVQTTQVYSVFTRAELRQQHARCSPAGRLEKQPS